MRALDRSQYLLVQTNPGKAHLVADELRAAFVRSDISIVSGPYDLVVRATEDDPLRDVIGRLREAPDVLRVLVCRPPGVDAIPRSAAATA